MMNEQGIPKGYKKTEVGVIPEEWNVNSLSEIGIFFKGKGIKRNDVAENGTTPCVRYGEIYTRYECYVTNPVSYVSDEVAFTAQPIDYGDLLFAGSGETADEIGKCVAYLGPTPAVAGGDVVVLRPRMVAPLFLGYLLNHAIVSKQKSKFGQGDAVVHISSNNLGKIIIPLPPLPEQRAIAAALSDVDGLLSALDALIAKKRALKTAAMQSLLTGRVRLPGFQIKPGYKRTEAGVIPEDWEVKTIGDVFSIQVGASKSQYISEHGKYWVVDMGSISPDGQLVCSKSTNHAEDFLNAGDLVMPKDDIGGGKIIGKVAYIPQSHKYILGDHVYALSLQVEGVPLFFSYLINRHETNLALKRKVAGSAQLGLSRQSVIEQRIPVPAIAEQRAIAAALADMDAEIAALESRREKVRQVKQGMMQVLLTGKVRLVTPAI